MTEKRTCWWSWPSLCPPSWSSSPSSHSSWSTNSADLVGTRSSPNPSQETPWLLTWVPRSPLSPPTWMKANQQWRICWRKRTADLELETRCWFKEVSPDKWLWWSVSGKEGMEKFGEDNGEERMWLSRSSPAETRSPGSESLRFIRQSCWDTRTFLGSLQQIIKTTSPGPNYGLWQIIMNMEVFMIICQSKSK